MPRFRFVRPDIVTIALSDGDTITIRKRLNNGERRAMFARMYKQGVSPGAKLEVDTMKTGLALVVAYLLDWSFVDEDGKKIDIAGLSPDDLAVLVDRLEWDDFVEVKVAIEAHVEISDGELLEKKAIGASE